jgi:hypothetical protein
MSGNPQWSFETRQIHADLEGGFPAVSAAQGAPAVVEPVA